MALKKKRLTESTSYYESKMRKILYNAFFYEMKKILDLYQYRGGGIEEYVSALIKQGIGIEEAISAVDKAEQGAINAAHDEGWDMWKDDYEWDNLPNPNELTEDKAWVSKIKNRVIQSLKKYYH